MNFMAQRVLIAPRFIVYSHAATFGVKSFGAYGAVVALM
jgi:hypothetical protein